jgi:hypothetical protein
MPTTIHLPVPPPSRVTSEHRIAPQDLWPVLPAQSRQKTLQSLSRLIAQRLPSSPPRKEETHESD